MGARSFAQIREKAPTGLAPMGARNPRLHRDIPPRPSARIVGKTRQVQNPRLVTGSVARQRGIRLMPAAPQLRNAQGPAQPQSGNARHRGRESTRPQPLVTQGPRGRAWSRCGTRPRAPPMQHPSTRPGTSPQGCRPRLAPGLPSGLRREPLVCRLRRGAQSVADVLPGVPVTASIPDRELQPFPRLLMSRLGLLHPGQSSLRWEGWEWVQCCLS
jgi:hypothetical protein